MYNIKQLEKNIEDKKMLIEKLIQDPLSNKNLIENAKKYIKRTSKKLKSAKIAGINNEVKKQPTATKNLKLEFKQILIDTSERKAISIKIKVGVLNALKKHHPKYQTLINAILEDYILKKKI